MQQVPHQVLNAPQYQPPSSGSAHSQIAHQLLNPSIAPGHHLRSSHSFLQLLSGGQPFAGNVLMQQLPHQLLNISQYQPPSCRLLLMDHHLGQICSKQDYISLMSPLLLLGSKWDCSYSIHS